MPSLPLVKIAKNVLNEKQLFPGNIASKFQQFLLFTKYIVFCAFSCSFFRLLAKIKKKLDLVRKANREREKLKLKKAYPFPQF